MTRTSIARHPLTATAALAWNSDLPRQLQQVLFDSAGHVSAGQVTLEGPMATAS
jgi:hypothetical protein